MFCYGCITVWICRGSFIIDCMMRINLKYVWWQDCCLDNNESIKKSFISNRRTMKINFVCNIRTIFSCAIFLLLSTAYLRLCVSVHFFQYFFNKWIKLTRYLKRIEKFFIENSDRMMCTHMPVFPAYENSTKYINLPVEKKIDSFQEFN